MKCVYCGNELKVGSLFCALCGKEAQIVPDYNEFEDEYINTLVGDDEQENKSGTIINTKGSNNNTNLKNCNSNNPNSTKKKKMNKKKKNKILLCSVIGGCLLVLLIIFAIIVGINKSHENSFDYHVQKAEEAFGKGDYKEAISYYEKALEIDAKNIEVRYELAYIYKEIKEYSAAVVVYKEIIAIDDSQKDAYKYLIEIFEADNNYEAIQTLYNNCKNDSCKSLFKDYLVQVPVFNLNGQTFDSSVMIKITSSQNYDVLYTDDGSDPIKNGKKFTEPFSISKEGETTIKAVCVNSKGIYSEVVTEKYTIEYKVPSMPVVSPDGGTFAYATQISIEVPEGCTAYYVWNSNPSSSSTKYTGPFKVIEGNNILSVIIINNTTGKSSEIYRGRFEYYEEDEE